MLHGYLDADTLRDGLGDHLTGGEGSYERSIEAASRQIDDWCSTPERRRFFWRETVATPRLFNAGQRRWVWVGDVADPAGMTVHTDDDDDGVFETLWDPSDWQLEPLVPAPGHPHTAVAAVAAKRFPIAARYQGRARVQVTAVWGWAAVPAEVAQACQILATTYQRSQHLTGPNLGGDELASGIGPIALARALVENLHVDGPKKPGGGGGGGGGPGQGTGGGGGGFGAERGRPR